MTPSARAVVFAVVVAVPSLGALQHSPLGNRGVAGYLALALPGLALAYSVGFPRVARLLTDRRALALGVAVVAAIAITTTIAIPLANRNVLPGANVRDETMNLAVGELLHGRYPYYAAVDPREPVTPLPGALFAAVPFVWLGSSGYQNVFWLALLFAGMRRYFGDWRPGLWLLLVLLVGAPVVVHELISGSDLLANSIWILIGVLLVAQVDRLGRGARLALACGLGLGLSSRLNFLALAPLLGAALVRSVGWAEALRLAALAATVWIAVTLPFYLYDPRGFSPLHVTRFVARFDAVLPHARLVIPAAGGALACALALRPPATATALLLRCAAVLAVPTLVGIPLMSLMAGTFEVGPYANFGVSFLFFAALALWGLRARDLGWRPA